MRWGGWLTTISYVSLVGAFLLWSAGRIDEPSWPVLGAFLVLATIGSPILAFGALAVIVLTTPIWLPVRYVLRKIKPGGEQGPG